MAIVIDANIALDWFLDRPGETARSALNLVAASGAIVPALWRWEVQDVLRRLHSSGRLSKPVDYICAELRELPISVDDELMSLFGSEASIAMRYNITVYDAAYLELAIRRGAPLVTSDKALAAAGKRPNFPSGSDAKTRAPLIASVSLARGVLLARAAGRSTFVVVLLFVVALRTRETAQTAVAA